jgi:hypothetical protein
MVRHVLNTGAERLQEFVARTGLGQGNRRGTEDDYSRHYKVWRGRYGTESKT